jgi:hypothetical protein
MTNFTGFLTKLRTGGGEGASLLKTYAGQNSGPVARPEFLAITLTIWLLTLGLHINDGAQLCMDIYVFGMFTVLTWLFYLRPESHHGLRKLVLLVVFGFVSIALGANLAYVAQQPLPTEPAYYHLAAFSSLDGPAITFVAYLLAFRLRTRPMMIITGIVLMATVLLSTNTVSMRVINYPDWIYSFATVKIVLTLATVLFASSAVLRLIALYRLSRESKSQANAA